ncbi:MAG: hypothetical protein OEY86_11575 [Nitrospira sp.]|nr:hypothetical protein [Nitrospira sp.]
MTVDNEVETTGIALMWLKPPMIFVRKIEMWNGERTDVKTVELNGGRIVERTGNSTAKAIGERVVKWIVRTITAQIGAGSFGVLIEPITWPVSMDAKAGIMPGWFKWNDRNGLKRLSGQSV